MLKSINIKKVVPKKVGGYLDRGNTVEIATETYRSSPCGRDPAIRRGE